MKTTLEGFNSRIMEAEEWISDMEDKVVATEKKIKRK